MADKDIQIRQGHTRDESVSSAESALAKPAHHGWGLYKAGRGYWVRVMTAVAFGTLFLAAALWAARQLEAYEPPVKAWQARVTQVQGTLPTPGQTVDVAKVENSTSVKMGTAVVDSCVPDGEGAARVALRDVMLVSTTDSPRDIRRVSVVDASNATVFAGGLSSSAAPEYKFHKVYVQSSVAGLVLVLGVFLIYRYVGNRPGTVDFLIATDEEMRKVNWSTRKIIMDSTSVVIGATFLIAMLIFIADLILKQVLLNQFVSR